MTDRENLCREFTELTGVHWHDFGETKCGENSIQFLHCRECNGYLPNPTYSNPADVLSRLYEYLTSLQWDNFVEKCGLWHTNIVMQDPDYTTLRKPYIAMEMLIGDSLLKAAVEFLKEGKK
jgi:hypothetical protein